MENGSWEMDVDTGIPAVGSFVVDHQDDKARTGRFYTKHGMFETPAFMPVGTQATVKGVTPAQLGDAGAQIILVNTYHLHLRPGDELIRDLGGIHKFMGWNGPMLSDSGGFQIFSLAELRKITDEGVSFQSHVDGAVVYLSPEKAVSIQENLGVDIMMALDECLPHGVDEGRAERSWQRSLTWAKRCQAARTNPEVLLFGIAQGSMYSELRKRSCAELSDLNLNGYAIGGLSVGEPNDTMVQMAQICADALPAEKIRYLMGVGTPADIVRAVACGIDLFDCVIPTRSARFGRLFCGRGWINIRNQEYRRDPAPIEQGCDCYTCSNFSRAYLAHLIHAKEMLGGQLATIHNLSYYQRLLGSIRAAIRDRRFAQFLSESLAHGEESLTDSDSSRCVLDD